MRQQAIFHIDEMQKWGVLLHNVKNLLSSYAESETEHTVEVLANGEAVRAYVANTEEKMQSKMESLHQEGVLFTACNNALNGQNIPKESLLPFVKIVPAGVRELVDKQMDGFAYIKP